MEPILVVDDEHAIADLVCLALENAGYRCRAAYSGAEAADLIEAGRWALVVLDVMLPDHDGYELKTFIGDETPVIFLTAKTDVAQRVKGLAAGAQDYICKPFEPAELVMRVNSCLRRSQAFAEKSEGANGDGGSTIILGDLSIDTQTRQVTARGERLELTAKEYNILLLLAERPNIVFTRQQILDAVWGYDYYGSNGVVAVFIRKLREKIEGDPSKPVHIITEWGVGYRIV